MDKERDKTLRFWKKKKKGGLLNSNAGLWVQKKGYSGPERVEGRERIKGREIEVFNLIHFAIG